MSIEEKGVEPVAVGQRPTQAPAQALQQLQRSWYSALRSPLWLCLLAALLIRVWLVYHTHGVIDGDEAMVGIQAEHILRGEHPYYYYGQPYMGSLEAYLMAILFAIAGPSVWMLRAEPILLSLGVVWLTWKLAGILADTAQLPPFAQQMFKTIAALFAAISPLYDTVLELRTLGGYIETFVLMLCLLIAAFQLTRRWQAGAANKELALRWAGIGFIVGLGYWVNPLIVIAVMAAAIWIVVFCIVKLVQLARQGTSESRQSPLSFLKGLLLAVAAIPACLVGLAPALRWGALYHWANFTYALQLGESNTLNINLRPYYHSRLALIHDEVFLYEKYVAPRVISGALPTESPVMKSIHSFTLDVGLFCIVATSILVVLSLVWHHPQLVRIRQLGALPLLFAICSAFTFCTSIASSAGLISFQNDIAGRYATPLMLVLPFFFATTFTLASMYIYKIGKRRALNSRENESNSSRPAPRTGLRRPRLSLVAQAILFALLFAYVGAQVSTYLLTDPDATYQSASCPIAPAYNDPIIAYLQHEHVHYAWAITWIGNPIIFKTNDGIIMSDPRTIIYHNGLGRIPAYTEAVLHADRPSMLTIVKHNDTYPTLLKILDAKQVTYKVMRFPSEPGYDVLVVTQLSRTVSVLESKDFKTAFPGCI
ncbi:MAG TPA: hypothetical protein VEL31_20305 [Ktedonobacteraceae bacterium]|nr:hypothetical protein [Ktedonobacteraceae bacterium]